MRSFLVALLPFFFLIQVEAQSDFVATNVGDTIYGKVSFEIPESVNESVTVKNDDGKQYINSNKIIFVQAKGKTYRSIRYGSKYRIMQEVIPGYLSLFKYRDGSFEFATNFLYKATGEGIATSAISFRRSVADFIKECEELSTAVSEKQYAYRDINEVVSQYNTTCLREVSQQEVVLVDLKELQTLLGDIISRQEKNEPVPEYLKKALKEYADQDIRSALLELVRSLEK